MTAVDYRGRSLYDRYPETLSFSTCITLLTFLDSAGGALSRARVVSRQRVLFSFLNQITQAYTCTYSYTPISVYVFEQRSWAAGRSLSEQTED